jgi:hypothetical protein
MTSMRETGAEVISAIALLEAGEVARAPSPACTGSGAAGTRTAERRHKRGGAHSPFSPTVLRSTSAAYHDPQGLRSHDQEEAVPVENAQC